MEVDHGRGFGAKNLHHMLRFGEVFEAEDIVYALSRQLSWTHLRSLIYIDDPLKREFYLEMCRNEGWSTRTLQGDDSIPCCSSAQHSRVSPTNC
ncbi:DUF1016 N-terminal domain-containing protein [Mycoavidus sp. B2-EB]|uniref:DUF1016 N-terminal domain-containing protein n=1 Tax=Mycoavidus sp. B2-EB TaxID=2651972 RepID=UPI0018E07AFF|nr:DUF1016 N-terminal domain-containing protein [Mycoavidus sp. B2-EB]